MRARNHHDLTFCFKEVWLISSSLCISLYRLQPFVSDHASKGCNTLSSEEGTGGQTGKRNSDWQGRNWSTVQSRERHFLGEVSAEEAGVGGVRIVKERVNVGWGVIVENAVWEGICYNCIKNTDPNRDIDTPTSLSPFCFQLSFLKQDQDPERLVGIN